MKAFHNLAAVLGGYWSRNQDLVITGTAALIVLLVAVLAWRFHRTKVRSRLLGNVATLMTIGWESQGVWSTAIHVQHIPTGFAIFAFTVFEMLLASAIFKAEEDRKEKGHPGWAGRYAFLIAITAGIYAALGEHTDAGVFQRLGLPLLVIGYYWYQLVADRNDDTPEVKELRAKMRADRADDGSVWVNPLARLLIKVGLKKPRGAKKTNAEREYRIERIVTLGYREYAGTWPASFHRWRLGVIAGRSDEEDVREAMRRLDRRIRIARILLPEGTRREQTKRQTTIQTDAQTSDRTTGQTTGRPDGRTSDQGVQTSEQTTGRPDGQTPGQTTEVDDRTPDVDGGDAEEPFPTTEAGLVARLQQFAREGKLTKQPNGNYSVADAIRAIRAPGETTVPGRQRAMKLLKQAGLYRDANAPAEPVGAALDELATFGGGGGVAHVNGHVPEVAANG